MSRQLLLPLQIDATGGFAFTTDAGRSLQQAIIAAVGTQRGERVMRPDYGSNLIADTWQPDDEVLYQEIAEQITDTLTRLVPEVSVLEVTVQSVEAGQPEALIRYSQNNSAEATVTVALPTGASS